MSITCGGGTKKLQTREGRRIYMRNWRYRSGSTREPLEYRVCTVCGKEKHKSLFHMSKAEPDGLLRRCKSCQCVIVREIRDRKKHRLKKRVTYWIRNPESDLVKVGRSAAPLRRLIALQVAVGVELEFLGYIEADVEWEFRNEFREQQVLGEWFRFVGPVKEYIEGVLQADGRDQVPE